MPWELAGLRFKLYDSALPPNLSETIRDIPSDPRDVAELEAGMNHYILSENGQGDISVSLEPSLLSAGGFFLTFAYCRGEMSRNARGAGHVRATLFLLPAFFAPTSRLRVAFHRLRGADIGEGVEIGYEVLIDNLYPERVHIGKNATVSARATILAHDEARAYAWGGSEVVKDTYIGEHAFLGVAAVVLAGIAIGPRAIVGAGSVVTREVPEGRIVAGVPAKEIGGTDS